MGRSPVISRLAGIVAAVVVFSTFSAQAGFWSKLNPFQWFSGRERVDSLMITGNYAKSRLLAELIQKKTGQPIMLVSPQQNGFELYFMPDDPEAMALDRTKFAEFVTFVRPKRIVVIGDSSYVPEEFVDEVRTLFPTVVVSSRDWLNNADALANLFKYRSLPKRYLELLGQLEEAEAAAHAGMGRMGAPAPVMAP